MTLKYRIGATLAAGAMMASVFSTHAFANTVISGNGNNSNNTVNLTNNSTTVVWQGNIMLISNNVTSNASTGGNQVNGNNGAGNATIDTGNASNNVTINNTGGDNTANITGCGCPPDDGDRKIKDNGNNSDNTINESNNNLDLYLQLNVLAVKNNVNTKAKTGHNEVKNNNGAGDKSVTTGNARNKVKIKNQGGNNTLNVGP